MPQKVQQKAAELADIIQQNPECHFHIDNDCWEITDKHGIEIANSSDFEYHTEWYSHSNQYGAALAEAMKILLNRKGYKISATAV